MAEKMNPVVKEKWLAALRSGEYAQARGALIEYREVENDDVPDLVGYCCLGVLCDLAVKEGVIESINEGVIESINESAGYQPHSVTEWAGFKECDPDDDEIWAPYLLAELNDAPDSNFNKIADYIQENL